MKRYFTALKLIGLWMVSPLVALPWFFLYYLAITTFVHPSGMPDPRRLVDGPTLYNLRWAARFVLLETGISFLVSQ